MFGTRIAFLLFVAALSVAACAASWTEFPQTPVSGQRCVGLPDPVCARMLADARREVVGGAGPVVGIEIVCTTTCTEANGEATVTRTYANGQTISGTSGWASPVGPAPGEPGGPPIVLPTALPVEPLCLGVDDARCFEFAADLLGNAQERAVVVSVEVRCTGVCTTATGDGTTMARFSDGTSQSADWSYRSE